MLTPQGFAESFIKGKMLQNGAPLLVSHAGAWFGYAAAAGWGEVPDKQVRAWVVKFLWRGLGEEKLTERFTGDVLACIQAALTVPDSGQRVPELFLTFRNGDITTTPAGGWIATQTHLLHVSAPARAADASLFTRGMVPCTYDPAAECPRWEQFVRESCPDDAEMLQMMFGLSLTYDRRFNVFFVIHGEAGTGKSTALDVLAALNAGAVCGVPLSDFGERFQTYPLTEYRLNLVQDMESVFEGGGSVSHREAVLKSCTAGEKLHVEQKHQKPEFRRLSALPVFGGNVLPRFADRSKAIAHRMRIISFPNVFRGTDSQDLQLADALRAELPGILNWALAGYRLLVAGGTRTFPETRNAAAIKADLIKSARPEELFCDDMLEVDPAGESVISTDDVYLAYHAYCARNNYKPVGANRIIPEICRYLGVEKIRRSTDTGRKMCLIGVRFARTDAGGTTANTAADDDF